MVEGTNLQYTKFIILFTNKYQVSELDSILTVALDVPSELFLFLKKKNVTMCMNHRRLSN